jgi:hypothetical protein
MDTFSTQMQNVRKNINMIKYLLRCIITILSMKLKIYIDDALIFTRVTLLVILKNNLKSINKHLNIFTYLL